ncbi:MAG: efflux RND transporter periplasmic adaptor subunit [Proteobacteria bacterium]|nr:efflux RND transporter periplasmic adaptor subunit [Pseudomonadota bacterium]MBS0495389.1 efflux RND transporter periplasmic adaptor subunit [Pseudomonadota bacterium]
MSSFPALVRPRPGLFLCSLAASVLLLAGCSRPEPVPEPVRSVKLITVGPSAVQMHLEYSGEVRARIESRIGFRVAGKIVRRQAELGQRVKAGQLLAQLDVRDYELATQAARAQVAAAKTQRDLAAADFQRFSKLKAQNFISGVELDRREAQLKSAQAQLDQARAQLASQGNQADYTRLLADAAGVITGIEAEPGQVVAAGAPVVRIARDGPRDAVFFVPEDRVGQLVVGQPVQVRAWAQDKLMAGQVRELAASADPVTRTFMVKVAVSGTDVPPLGATVYVTPQLPPGAGLQAIKLPTSSLRQEGGATAVWVYEPGQDGASGSVRSQVVQVATADGNEAVIAAGLTPGMQVVATGVHVLTPGQKVTVYKPKFDQTPAGNAPAAINSEKTAAPAAAR